MNNTRIVASFIPALEHGPKLRYPYPNYLFRLVAAILGGSCTLIGTYQSHFKWTTDRRGEYTFLGLFDLP